MAEYEYRWAGDFAGIIDGHTTPEGTAVVVEPGKHFKTTEPIDTDQVPFAVPVKPKTKTEDTTAESDATPTKETPS